MPDPESLCAALKVALQDHPELAGQPIALAGSGSDHVAFDVGGRFIVRIPTNEATAKRSGVERRLTKLLSPDMVVSIPVFSVVGPASEDLPFGFSGYARLHGSIALDVDLDLAAQGRLAEALGTFLRILHDSPTDLAAEQGVPLDDDPDLVGRRSEAIEDLEIVCAEGRLDEPSAWAIRELLGQRPIGRDAPCLIHGDFAAEHVLVSADGMPTGVIDWADAVIGDPALDLAGFLHWGGRGMLSRALSTYGACGEQLRERARWLATCRAVGDIVFGLDAERPEYVRAGERALVHLGLSPGTNASPTTPE
jgi:aminoglycoside phosphotransferase (APT) family kinase protein